jgi:hypothetical protein
MVYYSGIEKYGTDGIGDKLLVGTSTGTLRVYQVQEPNGMLSLFVNKLT